MFSLGPCLTGKGYYGRVPGQSGCVAVQLLEPTAWRRAQRRSQSSSVVRRLSSAARPPRPLPPLKVGATLWTSAWPRRTYGRGCVEVRRVRRPQRVAPWANGSLGPTAPLGQRLPWANGSLGPTAPLGQRLPWAHGSLGPTAPLGQRVVGPRPKGWPPPSVGVEAGGGLEELHRHTAYLWPPPARPSGCASGCPPAGELSITEHSPVDGHAKCRYRHFCWKTPHRWLAGELTGQNTNY